MTAITADHGADDVLARRNALLLALTQALSGANAVVLFSTGSIVGAMLAPIKSLATLPLSTYVIGLWIGTLPVGYLSRRFGRRFAFQVGTACGIATGLLCCLGVLQGSFAIFCLGSLFSGFYAAGHQAYRFAAADTASDSFRPKAISWVLAGGVFAGVLGPQLVIGTKDLWAPFMFAASYLAQATVALLAGCVLFFLNIPKPPAVHPDGRGRPLLQIARHPRFVVAVVCGIVSYAMMNMVMTSAPLAMVECQHTVTDAALGLQWHVIGMYAPSFFTGSLIVRFGVVRTVLFGFVILLASAAIFISGITLWHFWIALALLGIGWNFAFIGATALVTTSYRPNERNRVQAMNDFLIFGAMAIGSFVSGKILVLFGWAAVNEVVFPTVLLACALLIWLNIRERSRPAPI